MIPLSARQKKQIQIFKTELLEKNQRINLFSRKDPANQLKLLLDQGILTGGFLSPILSQSQSSVLDLGSGNGFPGLLFAIFFPQTQFILCEKNRKKAEFLKHTAVKAKISNASVLCRRAEDLESSYCMVLSQAAIPLKKMPKLLDKILSPAGQAFLWQSPNGAEHWSNNKALSLKRFKSYKIQKSEKILLQVRRVKRK